MVGKTNNSPPKVHHLSGWYYNKICQQTVQTQALLVDIKWVHCPQTQPHLKPHCNSCLHHSLINIFIHHGNIFFSCPCALLHLLYFGFVMPQNCFLSAHEACIIFVTQLINRRFAFFFLCLQVFPIICIGN